MTHEGRRYRNTSSIETAAIGAIADTVNPYEIFADLHTSYLVVEHFDAKKEGPEYENAIRTLIEGCEFVMELVGPDWGGCGDLKVQPPHRMESRCDRVREQTPGDLTPFFERLFLNYAGQAWGFEPLIVRLARLHDALPKCGSSADWEKKREQAVEAISRHLEVEIEEAERVLAETLNPPFDYHAYLRSPEWKAKRDAKVEAAGNRCQVCNSPDRLECHHRSYERIGDELPEDLFVLCRECHQTFHDNGRLAKP